MNTDEIASIVHSYNLPIDETAALLGLILSYREGRIKPEQIRESAKNRLTNAIVCRATGMQDFDPRLENVLAHFRRFNKENPWRPSR